MSMSQPPPLIPGGISSSAAVPVRTLEGNDVKVDSPAVTNANFDPQGAGVVFGAGWRSLLVFARFDQGLSPTITLEPLLLAQANSQEPSSWVRLPKTSALAEGQAAIIEVMGRRSFFRIDVIAGSPNKVMLFVAGYEPFRYAGTTRD
jgi:hypothetical protein